jgi:hypothetical protein
MTRCPYCNGDLDEYRKERRRKLIPAAVHRGVVIHTVRQGIGFSFALNGKRFEDQRRWFYQVEAVDFAKAMIDELLDSAKVQTLEED